MKKRKIFLKKNAFSTKNFLKKIFTLNKETVQFLMKNSYFAFNNWYYYLPPNLFLYTKNPNVPYERWISGAIFHGHGISQCNEIHLTFEWSNVLFTFLLDTENGENL